MHRSLATKFFLFTAALLFWVVLTLLLFVLKEHVEWHKWAAIGALVILVAAFVSRFTISLLARPLTLLERGIQSVAEGRLEPIQVSRTGDEIESLGEGFNKMIAKLILTQNEVRRQQDGLSGMVRQRTGELEREMEKTRAASQARGELVAGLSHQLRTAMNGLLGMIELARQSPLTAEQHDHLESACKSARELQSTLDSLLDLSEIEAGKIALSHSVFDTRALLEETLEAHRTAAAAKGIALTLDVAPDVPARMRADTRRLRQILNRLLANAVKFTGKGWVKLRVGREPAREGFVLVAEVIDTGIGIAAARQPGLFDASASEAGLGLPLSKRLVELHGGELTVQSQISVGTTFRCTIPSPSIPEEVHFTGQLLAAAGAVEAPPILVVEDNLVNQKVVTGMLRNRGYQVEIANHGREALEKLETQTYGLILMDIQMPVLDGFEATRLIRLDPRFENIPIVAMTALAMHGDRDRCLAAGMDGYVSKPLNTSTLLRVVEQRLVHSNHS